MMTSPWVNNSRGDLKPQTNKQTNKQINKLAILSWKNSRDTDAPIYLKHFIFVIYSGFISQKKEQKINVTGIMTIIPFDHLASSNRSGLTQPDHKNVLVI